LLNTLIKESVFNPNTIMSELYTIVDASKLDSFDFSRFVQTKESVRMNKPKTQFVVKYKERSLHAPGERIYGKKHICALMLTTLWR
jgi:hypothetical protein